MKIGIYGGSFNPPHLGHMAAAESAAKYLGLDELLLIPAGIPPHKMLSADAAGVDDRLAMTRLMGEQIALDTGVKVTISDMEIARGGKSYTADTLRILHEQRPDDELWLLMGTDMFLTFQYWYKPDEIVQYAGLCAFGRTEKDGEELFAPQRKYLGQRFPGSRIVTMTLPNLVDVSSTELRARIPKRETDGLLAPAVLGYIYRKHLYGTNLDLKRLTLEDLRPIALSYLKAKRIPHVLGTEQTAKALAEKYGADVEKARFAALLHDSTKRLSMEEQLAMCEHYHIVLDELEQHALKLLHAKTGAALARDVYGADDEIYNAILWHTTGKANMTLLEKVIYLADYIEPNRDFDGVEDLRKVVWEDLDKGLEMGLAMTVEEMEQMGNPVHHNTGRHTHRKEGFFERNCDEAWEQVKETFSHPGRLFAKVLLIALLCGVVAGGSYLLKIRAPELPSKDDGSKNNNTEQTDGIDYGDGVRPKAGGERKSKDFYTVLVLGRDTGGGGNTDTMLLASYDVTNQKATVMSIPRDTMVNVPWDVKKINSVYNYYGGGDKGIKALYKEISQLVGFEPDYQVVVEWEAVGAIVEAIGGVYFDVPYNMDYHDRYQDLVIEQEKGYRKLNGDDAMQVIRWRKNDSNSPYGNPQIGDSGRMQIQQDFLKAVIKQLLQLENVPNLGKLAEVFRENVETDLSFENILWFGKQAVIGGLSLEDVSFMTMPWTGIYVYSRTLSAEYGRTMKLDYVVPQANALLDLVNDSLSPFTEKFTLRDLDIMSVNADGSLASSTGRVEDSKAAAAPPVFVDPYTGRIANSSESTGGETEENDPPAEVTSGSLTVIGEATGNE